MKIKITQEAKDGDRTISVNFSDWMLADEFCEELYRLAVYSGYAPQNIIDGFIKVAEEQAGLIGYKTDD